jgi:uncharacterized membrane protein
MEVRQGITVNRPAGEVYRFWRDFGNLARYMEQLESVEITGEGRSHWRARGPAGTKVEWDAEITADEPDRLIAWRSLPGSTVETSGRVRFAPAAGGRGTEVRVELGYELPAGALGKAVARLFGEVPARQLEQDLRRCKQILETGQVIESEATIHRRPHPARPPESPAAGAADAARLADVPAVAEAAAAAQRSGAESEAEARR